MNPAVFVDTSAWYAIADADDVHHAIAVGRMNHLLEQRRVLITSNQVAGETYTLLRVRLGASAAREFLRRLRRSRAVRRIFISEAWEEAAEDLLAKYDDQDFSYVDATSFTAMQHLGLQEAFSFDHHFRILGFVLTAF